MGCTASKLDNEDTVRRCKERRRLMKDAVHARHHLASAHSDYCRSLRLTGSALTSFAAGEPLSVSHHTPAVLLPTTTPSPSHSHHFRSSSTIPPPPPLFSHSSTTHPPPPPHISHSSRLHHHRKPSIKLPHILSESSLSSSPRTHTKTQTQNQNQNQNPPPSNNFTYNAQSTYSSTPSQASSAWDWENFYPPPSPPGSEFYNQLNNNNKTHKIYNNEGGKSSTYSYPHTQMDTDDDKASTYSYSQTQNNQNDNRHMDADDDYKSSPYSFFQNQNQKQKQSHHQIHPDDDKSSAYSYSHTQNNQKHNRHMDADDESKEREEVQYSEWDDHYNTTTSSEEDDGGDGDSRSEIGTHSNFGSSVHGGESKGPPPAAAVPPSVSKSDDVGSSASGRDMRMVVRHRDLAEIMAAIKENFDKAASAGEEVSEMLETGRAQLDRSFRQLKKTVYHSSGVLSNLSSSWTSKPPLAVKYQFEPGSIGEPGGPKSLCSTLERLLAWEKKLYQEVKAREGVKIEHEKKLASLQSQEYKGGDEAKVDKTKTSIKRLQSLILVTSQAVSTTNSSIVGLRDSELVPQLVELCHGFMYMWKSMNQFHEVQNHIVQQVRGLVNQSTTGESTSDLHRQATRDLESAVSAWHSSFCRLIKSQQEFIRSLHGWFRLTILPLTTEPTNFGNNQPSEALAFCDEWKLALDRLPDTVASEAIKSFINVVHSISSKQTEELKIKKRTESASKELEKKSSSLRNIEKKYYNSYSMVGIGLPDPGPDNSHGLDARDPLAEKKSELAACRRRVEDEMVKHSKAVEVTRAMTLNNIQTGLPGVFQAMTSFSALIMEALETACTRSYSI